MKLIYAIVHSDDSASVTEELNKAGFSVTKLASTGGFLKRGNTTLLIGTEEEKVEDAIHIIKEECGERKQMSFDTVCGAESLALASYLSVPVTVDVGGATIFVMDVERFEKI